MYGYSFETQFIKEAREGELTQKTPHKNKKREHTSESIPRSASI